MNPGWLIPDWPAPANVRALVTTRHGGVSAGPYASFNLGGHVGDSPVAVAQNRALLRGVLPDEPKWLEQVHGIAVADAASPEPVPCADAAVATEADRVCAVMTADCLPVLLCDQAGQVVAAAHAGWRGLVAGILEETVKRMRVAPESVLAWLGPAIGPDAFEVGAEVLEAFAAVDRGDAAAFRPGAAAGKWQADLFFLARRRLERAGVTRIYGGGVCTYADPERFFSYRRDGVTGRFASLVWRSA